MVEDNTFASDPSDPDKTELYPTDMPVTSEPSAKIGAGTRIGPYRILRHIADGGMGAVYLAEREDHFKQRVALKMIHPDKASDAVLQRFYAERQILADLTHPHIARIFDGGATQDTLPFFVMEYVEGEPFDEACAELSLFQKLKLFQKVCNAVHHAHRSLIVHRDLKSSNILVTANGEPKLLDFGIAKLLDRRHDERSAEPRRSDPGPMTLAFASPEQLSGDPITISTDIYSLGVLLYKVLSGRHPHHQPKMSTTELIHAILQAVPAPPSQVAEVENPHRLAGDLDAIALKTLSKRPEDRYNSAAQLAEEIQLYLDDLPIRAWKGTWLGRLRKNIRRNKLAFAATAFLLTFSSTVTVLWRHAVRQQIEAERARTQAERTHDFISNFFKAVEPDRSPGPEVDLKKILDSGRRSLEKDLKNEPQIRADLLGTLATVYHALGLYDDALHLQEEAVAHRRTLESRDPIKFAIDLNNLAVTYGARKEYLKAEALLQETLPLWRQLDDPRELRALASLGATLVSQDRVREAIAIYEQTLRRSEAFPTKQPSQIAHVYYGLGAAHKRLEDFAEAEPYLRRALDTYGRDPETKASRIAQVQSSLGEVLHVQNRNSEARPFLEEALTTRQHLFGDLHLKTAASQKKLARLLIDLGELDTAEVLLEQAGGTYSKLQHEAGTTEVREAQDRLAEIPRRRASQIEPNAVASVAGDR